MGTILTVEHVAAHLRVNDPTVRRFAQAGKLRGVKLAAGPSSHRGPPVDGRVAPGPSANQPANDRIGGIVDALHLAYGEADLGNLPDAIDELVYISLTRQTHHQNATRSWSRVLDAGGPAALVGMPEESIVELLQRGGLAHQKARWIRRSLEAIRDRMGSLSLDRVADWPDNDVEAFLSSLPGISIKSAKCIMLYSLGRSVLPVDTHVRRVSTRLGLAKSDLSEPQIHQVLEARVSPEDRFSFHVNCIWHGRQVCTPKRPRCGGCVIREHCDRGRALDFS